MKATQTALDGIGTTKTVSTARCSSCGRTLTNPVSIDAGMGPVCRGKSGAGVGVVADEDGIEDEYLSGYPPSRDGYIWKRERGKVLTNVPHHVVSHSPTGYEFGHGGSGPADLALNILQDYMLNNDYVGPRTECRSGWCFAAAWALHHYFKFEFIGPTGGDEGGVGLEEIHTFLLKTQAMGVVSPSCMAMATGLADHADFDPDRDAAHYAKWLAALSVNRGFQQTVKKSGILDT